MCGGVGGWCVWGGGGREAHAPPPHQTHSQGPKGLNGTLQLYVEVMRGAKTNGSLPWRARLKANYPLYAASGLLSYGATEGGCGCVGWGWGVGGCGRACGLLADVRVRLRLWAGRGGGAMTGWDARPPPTPTHMHTSAEWRGVQDYILASSLTPKVVHKELFIAPERLAGEPGAAWGAGKGRAGHGTRRAPNTLMQPCTPSSWPFWTCWSWLAPTFLLGTDAPQCHFS